MTVGQDGSERRARVGSLVPWYSIPPPQLRYQARCSYG